jgi:tRNA1(Val) A37 N6-methylase TrmN6
MVRPVLNPRTRQRRKAAGIYYTPDHIVAPIVKATVGELCRGKTPSQIARLRIIDPACGNGQFLLGAYRYILKNHGRQVLESILHGVDIDPRAVELARTSLSMRDNIRCADSLRETECGIFDAVIGNPPFGARLAPAEQARLSSRYPVFALVKDTFVAFIERAFELLKPGGRFGFVLPSAWLGGPRYRALREFLLSYRIESVRLLPFDSFPDAYVDTVVVIASKAPPQPGSAQQLWREHPDRKFILDPDMAGLLSKIAARIRTRGRDLFGMKRGVLFNPELLQKHKTSNNSHRYFQGSVYRYRLDWSAPKWVEFGPRMKERPKEFSWFKGKRILLRRLVNRRQRLMAAFTDRTVITSKNLYSIRPREDVSPYYLLGILNSRLISRLYLSQVAQATKDDFPQITIRDVLDLPFPPGESRRLADLVEQMLAKRTDEIDEQIDRLVYDLYGLNDAEIGTVEGHRASSS